MNTLKDRLLSSIENHGKVDIHGPLGLYPGYLKFTILRNLFILRNEGWIIIRKHRTIDGIKTDNPNVRRSSKQLFTQKTLFND